jgi:hypothetical protein
VVRADGRRAAVGGLHAVHGKRSETLDVSPWMLTRQQCDDVVRLSGYTDAAGKGPLARSPVARIPLPSSSQSVNRNGGS